MRKAQEAREVLARAREARARAREARARAREVQVRGKGLVIQVRAEVTTIQCPALVKEGVDNNGRPSVKGMQCTIFDASHATRLIGIGYIVSERLFQQLPEDEKRLWHSHHYETTSHLTRMANILKVYAETQAQSKR